MSNEATPASERDLSQRIRDKAQEYFNPPTEHGHISWSTKFKPHPSRMMKALEWQGKEEVQIADRHSPMITDQKDAIIRITSTTICGSDLHMYFDALPFPGALQKGDIIGHEGMGVVEEVGSEVRNIRVGDRVVISAPIACGDCDYCKRGEFSSCDCTNPSSAMESSYGQRTAALFGYSHLCGGVAGCQAEFVRTPFADVNLLKVPENLSDEKLLVLSDILCTGWHANEKAQVGQGDTVVIWGCGPVGLMSAYLAKFRGAKRVISIDNVPHRLRLASEVIGVETINFDEFDVKKRVAELMPGGPDCCIDCVGFRFPKSWTHWFLSHLKLETDAIDVVEEMIYVARKGGRLALIGDYFAYASKFPIGAFMEKGLQMSGGQLFCQKYWGYLLEQIESGKLDPSFIWSHKMKFEQISEAYQIFGHYKDNVQKILLRTEYGEDYERQRMRKGEGTRGATTGGISSEIHPAARK
jgi:threonine dehydrogenase-like Zn-dependent dehydrogenase